MIFRILRMQPWLCYKLVEWSGHSTPLLLHHICIWIYTLFKQILSLEPWDPDFSLASSNNIKQKFTLKVRNHKEKTQWPPSCREEQWDASPGYDRPIWSTSRGFSLLLFCLRHLPQQSWYHFKAFSNYFLHEFKLQFVFYLMWAYST